MFREVSGVSQKIAKSLEIPKNFKASMVEIIGIEPLTS